MPLLGLRVIICVGGSDLVDSSKKSTPLLPRAAVISALVTASLISPLAVHRADAQPSSQIVTGSFGFSSDLVQDDDSIPDEDAVPPNQVDKYIAVYSAMQKNHGLSVAQATSKEGMTVSEFRTLEDKIQRNPAVHERVLDALKASANGMKPKSGAAGKSD